MVVEEAAEGSDNGSGHEERYDEKGPLSEKVPMQLQADYAVTVAGLGEV
jgi:hypothetical protein